MDGETDGLELTLAELERERQEEQLEREAEEALALSHMPEEEAGGKHLRASKALEATGNGSSLIDFTPIIGV